MRSVGWWTDHVVPRLVDKLADPPEAREQRRQVCNGIFGEVVEIGFGSGVNVTYYPSGVTSVAAVEPSVVARKLAARRLANFGMPITYVGLDSAAIPVPNDCFDAALSTLTLCTVDDPAAVLREIHRVLKPGGVFAFLEHGAAPEAGIQRWQRRLEPLQVTLMGGCHLSRDVAALFAASEFALEDLRQFYLPGQPAITKPFGYLSGGLARKGAGRAGRRPGLQR